MVSVTAMGEKPILEGKLDFISLADIFQILGGNNGTGVLQLNTPHDPYPGLIYFIDGNPVNASCVGLSGLRALHALFGWVEGRFEFREEEVRTSRLIKQSRMQIVLDAMRMLDDGTLQKIGPPAELEEPDDALQGREDGLEIIKGPLIDYPFIIAEEEFHEGERILREGGHGKWIWVIMEGAVGVSRETGAGPFEVARLGEGCFIGSVEALLFKDHARSASVHALRSVRLGLLDAERLSRIYTSLSHDFRKVVLQPGHRLRKITDNAVEAFAGRARVPVEGNSTMTVIEIGSPSEELHAIIEGEAVVMGRTRKGVLPLVKLGKEDVFGFIPFLHMGHEPRSAAVVASKNLKTRPLDVESLQREYNRLPATFRNLIYCMGLFVFFTTRTVYRLFNRSKNSADFPSK